MRKTTLSLIVFACLADIGMAEDTISQAFDDAKFSGQFRTFYIDRTYEGIIDNNRNSLAVGGNLGFETGSFNGLSIGARMYSTNLIDIHDGDPRTSASFDPSLFGGNLDSYTYLGELYLNYKFGNTNIKAGRQKLDTPMAGSDDARMLPNLFEAIVVSNTDIKDTTLIAAHVSKESVGTFGNVYPAGNLSLHSGYGLGYKDGTSGSFEDMGHIALGAGVNTDGVTAVAAIYSGLPGLKLQVWDYYAHDILNTLYVQGDYSWDCKLNSDIKMNAAAQYINQVDVGDKLGGSVDSNYFGVKLGSKIKDLDISLAYSKTGKSIGDLTNGGIITPWGGMPAFTQAMVTRHQFFADTTALKGAVGYNFKTATNLPVTASVYYTNFDIGSANAYKPGDSWDASEAGFDIAYKPVSSLEFKLRANFPRDFSIGQDINEYRVIMNYNF